MAKHTKSNITSEFFGMLLLAAGLGAGIVLVTQPQLLAQKAQTVTYASCPYSYDYSVCKEIKTRTEQYCSKGKACVNVFSTVSCPNPKCNGDRSTGLVKCIIDLGCVIHKGEICNSDSDCELRLLDKRAKCIATTGAYPQKFCDLVK